MAARSTDSHAPLYPPQRESYPPTSSPRHSPDLSNDPAAPLSPNSPYGYGDTYHAYAEQQQAQQHSSNLRSKELTDPPLTPRQHPPQRDRGRWRAFWAAYKSRNQILFLSFIALQAVAVLALIALVYATVRLSTGDVGTLETLDNDPELESVATYLSLFILAVVFEIGITLDAAQQKNIMTLSVLCLFQVAMLVYSAVLPTQLRNALTGSSAGTDSVLARVRIYSIIIPCVVAAATVAMTGMLYPLRAEFGWDVFKRIGADIYIRRAYIRYQAFVCLLKFDGFFFVGFAVQFLVLVSGTPTAEFIITIVALPVIMVALALFAIVVRIESRAGVYASFVVQAAGMGYFVFKIVRIYAQSDRYKSARITLTIFGVIALAMLLATFVMMGLCMLNFGKGLREKIPGYAFNGGKSLFSRSSQSRLPSHHNTIGNNGAGAGGAGGVGGAGGIGGEKRPGVERNGSSYGYGAERRETRMSID